MTNACFFALIGLDSIRRAFTTLQHPREETRQESNVFTVRIASIPKKFLLPTCALWCVVLYFYTSPVTALCLLPYASRPESCFFPNFQTVRDSCSMERCKYDLRLEQSRWESCCPVAFPSLFVCAAVLLCRFDVVRLHRYWFFLLAFRRLVALYVMSCDEFFCTSSDVTCSCRHTGFQAHFVLASDECGSGSLFLLGKSPIDRDRDRGREEKRTKSARESERFVCKCVVDNITYITWKQCSELVSSMSH